MRGGVKVGGQLRKQESRGSKRSTTNQTTVSAQVGVTGFEPVAARGPMSEHPSSTVFNQDVGVNSSMLDATDFNNLNGSLDDSQSNLNNRGKIRHEANAYYNANNTMITDDNSPNLQDTSYFNQNSPDNTSAHNPGIRQSQNLGPNPLRLSMSNQKNDKAPQLRTAEKNLSQGPHHPSQNPFVRPKQQFSIAHLQMVNKDSSNHMANRRRVVSSSQSLKQRGTA